VGCANRIRSDDPTIRTVLGYSCPEKERTLRKYYRHSSDTLTGYRFSRPLIRRGSTSQVTTRRCGPMIPVCFGGEETRGFFDEREKAAARSEWWRTSRAHTEKRRSPSVSRKLIRGTVTGTYLGSPESFILQSFTSRNIAIKLSQLPKALHHSSHSLRIGELQKQTAEIATIVNPCLTMALRQDWNPGHCFCRRGFVQSVTAIKEKVDMDCKIHDVAQSLYRRRSTLLLPVFSRSLHNSEQNTVDYGHVEVEVWGTPMRFISGLATPARLDSRCAKGETGLGLISMAERLKLLNDAFNQSTTPRGTTIRARVLLHFRKRLSFPMT